MDSFLKSDLAAIKRDNLIPRRMIESWSALHNFAHERRWQQPTDFLSFSEGDFSYVITHQDPTCAAFLIHDHHNVKKRARFANASVILTTNAEHNERNDTGNDATADDQHHDSDSNTEHNGDNATNTVNSQQQEDENNDTNDDKTKAPKTRTSTATTSSLTQGPPTQPDTPMATPTAMTLRL